MNQSAIICKACGKSFYFSPSGGDIPICNTCITNYRRDNKKKLEPKDVTNKYILENNFAPFILSDGEFEPPTRTSILIKDVEAGGRIRQLKGRIEVDENSSPALKKLCTDGNKFTIYFENDDAIVASEVLYFKDRPVQIELKPNEIKHKQPRAKRIKVTQNGYVKSKDGVKSTIVTNDISKTGISFYADDNIANAGDKLHFKSGSIIIVERRKYGSKYFYRGYFGDDVQITGNVELE